MIGTHDLNVQWRHLSHAFLGQEVASSSEHIVQVQIWQVLKRVHFSDVSCWVMDCDADALRLALGLCLQGTCSSGEAHWPVKIRWHLEENWICELGTAPPTYLQSKSRSTLTREDGSRRSPPRCPHSQYAEWAHWTCSVFPCSAPEGEPADGGVNNIKTDYYSFGAVWPVGSW